MTALRTDPDPGPGPGPATAVAVLDREWVRQLVASPPGLLGLLVPGGPLLKVLALWDIVAVIYLALTYRTYRTAGPVTLQALVRSSRRRGLVDRLVSSPPRQFPASAAVLALITTLLVIPQARQAPSTAALVLTLGVCVIAVLSSWSMVQFGFAVGYLSRFVEHGGLEFPGDQPPVMVDFLYFSVAVGTSFSTPDVSVTDRGMRRQVLGHSLLAFAFNTVILASAVAVVGTLLVPAS